MHSCALLLEELDKRTKRRYILGQRIFYEHGNKCGHRLARSVQSSKLSSMIHSIHNNKGDLLVKNEEIAKEFESFYSKLYNLQADHVSQTTPDVRTELIKNFLARYSSNPITSQQSLDLESKLSITELETAVKQIKVGKSLGPDGFTLQYYKSFPEALFPRLLATLNTLSDPQVRPDKMLTAHITVIPKEGKDLSIVANYRPISLLNVDIKIYAKILANRLLHLVPELISSDQVGFVPGREARDNTIRTLNVHCWLVSSKTQGV